MIIGIELRLEVLWSASKESEPCGGHHLKALSHVKILFSKFSYDNIRRTQGEDGNKNNPA
ncbi:hypothetical protein [Paenibacillus wenxiniae]|uniref:Uncharacterized protein n=1 Tax=Paenibacillus wenxiniae TaxID=1636843 RepID=A0ABW4RNG3_9BACL